MPEFTPPCIEGNCPSGDKSRGMQLVCQSFGKAIIEAGGASLVEAGECPLSVYYELTTEPINPELIGVARKLKPLGIFDER